MRWRPQEDDPEQRRAREGQVAGRGGVPDERRHRAGRTADDDVLRRRPLQPARVDDHVEARCRRARGARSARSGRTRATRTRARRARARTRALVGAGTRPEATGRLAVRSPISLSMSASSTWLSALAPPHASASPIVITVRSARFGHATGADEHPGDPGDQQQAHDPRLGQRDVVAPRPQGQRSPRSETTSVTRAAANDAPATPTWTRRRPARVAVAATRPPVAIAPRRSASAVERCRRRAAGTPTTPRSRRPPGAGSATRATPQCVRPSSSAAETTTIPSPRPPTAAVARNTGPGVPQRPHRAPPPASRGGRKRAGAGDVRDRVEVVRRAAATSCTTRACRRATGRCRHAVRSAT